MFVSLYLSLYLSTSLTVLFFNFLIWHCATESLVINDPDFQHEDLNFLSRSERYDAAMKKSVQMFSKLRDYGISDPEEIYFYKRYQYRWPSLSFLYMNNWSFFPSRVDLSFSNVANMLIYVIFWS